MFTIYGTAANDSLGTTVASLGDLDGDGISEFATGLKGASVNAPGAGAVQVHKSDGTLMYRLDGQNLGDRFGKRVAAAGDMTGDGVPDFLVGANRFDGSGGQDCGAIFLYSGADASLVWRFDGPHADARFGAPIIAGEDLDGDNHPDMLVGTTANGPSGDKSGSVVAINSFGHPIFTVYGESAYDLFSGGLCWAGDVNGDYTNDFLVGAPQSAVSGVDNGQIYMLSGANGDFLYSMPSSLDGSEFGIQVNLIGDTNNDGSPEFVIAAPLADTSLGADSGIASVFSFGDIGPAIWLKDFNSGQYTELGIRNAEPNAALVFAWSASGGGPISTPWGTGLLSHPINQIPASANHLGIGAVGNHIPLGTTGLALWFQAVDLTAAEMSNGLAVFVQ